MDREAVGNLIKKAKALDVKISEKLLALWQAGGMNSAQHDFFVRQLKSGIEQKTVQPLSAQARELIKTCKELGVEKQYYDFLSRPGTLPSMEEVKLMSELRNRIEDKRQEKFNQKGEVSHGQHPVE